MIKLSRSFTVPGEAPIGPTPYLKKFKLNTVSRLEIETPTKKKIKKLQTKWPVDYDLWELLIGPMAQ